MRFVLAAVLSLLATASIAAPQSVNARGLHHQHRHETRDISDDATARLKARSPTQVTGLAVPHIVDDSIFDTTAVHQLEARAAAEETLALSTAAPSHEALPSQAPVTGWRKHRKAVLVTATYAAGITGVSLLIACSQGKLHCKKRKWDPNSHEHVPDDSAQIQIRAVKADNARLEARNHLQARGFKLTSFDFAGTRGFRLKTRSPTW